MELLAFKNSGCDSFNERPADHGKKFGSFGFFPRGVITDKDLDMTKTKLMISAAALTVAAVLAPQASQAAPAFGATAIGNTPAMTTDVGHRRDHYRARTRLYVRNYGYGYRPYGYGYRRSFAADPSFGYYPTLRRFQAEGRCVHDLGYGRFEVCD